MVFPLDFEVAVLGQELGQVWNGDLCENMVFGYGLVEVVGLKLGGYYPSSVLSDLILLILQQPNVHDIKFGLVLRQRFDILNRTLSQFL